MAETNTGSPSGASRPDPLVGRRLASYEVLARVARGGMGVVYRARHVYIDKIVALKVLDPALAQRADLIERFRTEAQSLARVEHENVIKVIDILEDKGVHFIVMDFAEGTNLREKVKAAGPMPGEELLSVARQTAEALYAAHREGILHRDIKPENLIMNSRGRCKLADFGLAGDLRLIKEGHEGPLNFGTPAYSAPEVMRKLVPNKRSDIFSYGATLYFLATGEPPFGQTGAQAIMMRQQQGAELLEGKRPDLPPKFTQLIMDCIRYHPKDRPADFIEVMDRLPRRVYTRRMQAATEPTDVLAMDTGTHETPESSPGSRRVAVISAAVALSVVVLVGGLWISSWFTGSSNEIADTGNEPINTPPANRRPPADNAPDVPPPDNQNAFKPEDEAFNAAELDSRSALAARDYKAAVDAWTRYLAAWPDSPRAREARDRHVEVLLRVADLRTSEYDNARQASDDALKDKRTGEAIAALERFPAELLVPLTDTDDVAVARRLTVLRETILSVEAADLTRVLERADGLRSDWLRDQHETDVVRRGRTAGNLLAEQSMLKTFLVGRTSATIETVERRLKELQVLLDGVREAAAAGRDAWRRFHDGTLGDWAVAALQGVEASRAAGARRDLKAAVREISNAENAITALRTREAREARQGGATPQELLAQHIEKSEFVLNQLKACRADLTLAERLPGLLEAALREMRTGNATREFSAHVRIEDDGTLSSDTERYIGRLVSVTATEIVLDAGGARTTIQLRRLTAATVRRTVGTTENLDDSLALIAWLVAVGAADEAEIELQRLSRISRVPDHVVARGRALAEGNSTAVMNLKFVAARTGKGDGAGLEGTRRRLLTAQAGVRAGDSELAKDYLLAVSEQADPELVHLATYAQALELATPGVADLRVWVQLEPRNAAACVALAKWLKNDGKTVEATLQASHALVLDGSSEEAWGIALR